MEGFKFLELQLEWFWSKNLYGCLCGLSQLFREGTQNKAVVVHCSHCSIPVAVAAAVLFFVSQMMMMLLFVRLSFPR